MSEAKISFVDFDVSKYSNLNIDPFTKLYPGPLTCSSLNAFFALPDEIKPLFFDGLKKAYDLFPAEIAQAAR